MLSSQFASARLSECFCRELGHKFLSSRQMSHRHATLLDQFSQLDVDYSVAFQSGPGAITDMSLEAQELRFGRVHIFDVDRAVVSGVGGYRQYHPVASATTPSGPPQRHQFPGHSSPVVCLHWYTVDSGLFFTAALNKTVHMWDTNAMQSVESLAVEHPVTRLAMSKTAVSHNLLAVGLGSTVKDSRTVLLVDPGIGATALALTGGHSDGGVASLVWSPGAANLIVSGGFDGRILFWDIRFPGKPLYALDKHASSDNPSYSFDAVGHSGPVLSLDFTSDGLHLLSWGGSGSRSMCLRLWSGGPGDSDLPTGANRTGPRLCPINFGNVYSEAVVATAAPRDAGARSLTATVTQCGPMQPVRMASTALPLPSDCGDGALWGGSTSTAFVPVKSRLLISHVSRVHQTSRLVSRHHAPIRACVWNARTKELYTCGVDHNLFMWPLYPDSKSCDSDPLLDVDDLSYIHS